MEIGEKSIWILLPAPHVEIPEVQIVFTMHSLTHDFGRYRVTRPGPKRHDEFHTVQPIVTIREALVEENLRLVDFDFRVHQTGIRVMVSHRTVMFVYQTILNLPCVANRSRRINRL